MLYAVDVLIPYASGHDSDDPRTQAALAAGS